MRLNDYVRNNYTDLSRYLKSIGYELQKLGCDRYEIFKNDKRIETPYEEMNIILEAYCKLEGLNYRLKAA